MERTDTGLATGRNRVALGDAPSGLRGRLRAKVVWGRGLLARLLRGEELRLARGVLALLLRGDV